MPIQAVVGYQGAGKTYFAVMKAYQARIANPALRVVTNIPGFILPIGEPPDYVGEIDECFDLKECHLLLDEFHLWFGARQYKSHGPRYIQWASQLRKRRIDLWLTAQTLKAVDSLMREMIHYTYVCDSWKKINVFYYRSFNGWQIPTRGLGIPSPYIFNPYIAACYPRFQEIETVERG